MPEGFREIDDPRIEGAVIESAKARKAAYAPYSRFKMGSAVVTDTGTIIRGALVENVSLGLAMCAERVALFASVAQELGRPEILVVNSKRTSGKLTWPLRRLPTSRAGIGRAGPHCCCHRWKGNTVCSTVGPSATTAGEGSTFKRHTGRIPVIPAVRKC